MSSAATNVRTAGDRNDRIGPVDRLARSIVHARLSKLGRGTLTVVDLLGSQTFGPNTRPDLVARVAVHNSRFYRRCVSGGSLGAAASFLDGDWTCDDLTTFFRMFVPDASDDPERHDRGLSRIGVVLAKAYHGLRKNTRAGSRRNIHDHYDLGNDLFALFLDETMSYSCGVFERPDATLLEASLAKLDRVGRKLALSPGDHLLEIGTGWGGLAIHVASKYGCRVTTTTISTEQADLAKERIATAGLADRIAVLVEDYRDLKGEFDKLVSIEMIEAVGHDFLPTYFQQISHRLKPGGLALVQAITMPDAHYERYRRSTDFIQRYVFPGSCVPSLGAIAGAVRSAGDLSLVDREEIGPHYATTLEAWRKTFFEKLDDVKRLGYPDRFVRLWDYYFCYCEAGFIERYLGNSQLLYRKAGAL